MKHIKIAAGLAHVNYGNIAGVVKTAADAGVDYIHSDAADMHDLKNMQLMGGHQIIEGIRPVTDLPIECHFYTNDCDRLFIEKIAAAGANMLILPAEKFIGAPLAYIMNYCHEFGMKIGLTLGCYTPPVLRRRVHLRHRPPADRHPRCQQDRRQGQLGLAPQLHRPDQACPQDDR